MTGCCRNGSWPSRGQDNNLPAIYFFSPFSDRKKPAKNTPYIILVCVVTLGSHIVPTSCSEEGQCWVQTRLLRALSNQSWKTSKTGDSTTSLCSLFQCLPLLLWKDFFLCQIRTFHVLWSWILECQVYLELFRYFCPLEESPSWMLLLGSVIQSVVLTAVSFPRSCNARVQFLGKAASSFANWDLEMPSICVQGISRQLQFTDKLKQMFL